MFARHTAIALMLLALSTPAMAQSDNLQLFRSVQRQVLRYTQYTIFDSVQAEVNGGMVTLTGKVTMPYKSQDLERRVAEVAGVTQVDNKIAVLPVSRWDDELRFRIARAIYGNPNFHMYGSMVNPPIHIIVEGGRVTLEGVVNSNVDRMLARSIASSFNTFGVTNDLKTDAEVKEQLEKL